MFHHPFIFILYFLRLNIKEKYVKKENEIISYETNLQCSDSLVFCFCISFKLSKDKKKTGKSHLMFSLNDSHVLTIRANRYGDKNAGSMSFV